MSASASDHRLRDRVHAELSALHSPGGALADPPPDLAPFFTEAVRLEVATEYRARRPNAPSDGRAVIVTAGPPGAGKSTALAALDGIEDYRRIDPDEIKDLLLGRAAAEGLLDLLGSITLPDGRPVALREVSWWVHHVSTDIADDVRALSLSRGENVVVEGTLQWRPLAETYTSQLGLNDYERLTVLDVEVPLEVAVQQARHRWWDYRTGTDPLGGRFMSDEAVARFYDAQPVAGCAVTARDLSARASDAGIVTDLVVISRTKSGSQYGARIHGGDATAFEASPGTGAVGASTFGVPCLGCGQPLTGVESVVLGYGPNCVGASA